MSRLLSKVKTNTEFNTNVLNSYYGYNSIYKNWSGFANIEHKYQSIGSNGFAAQNDCFGDQSTPVSDQNNNIWSTYWPTLEESFQCPEPVQPIYPWIQSGLRADPVQSWSSGFWNNINNSQSKPSMAAQELMDCRLDTGSSTPVNSTGYHYDSFSAQSADRTGNRFDYKSSNRRVQSPIGTGANLQSMRSQTHEPLELPTYEPTEGMAESSSGYIQPRMRRRMPTLMECVFCKNNNERPEFYRSHILKDPECRIVCPVLRAYNCPICQNGGGEKAHTVRYCPLNKAGIQAKIERLAKSHLNAVHKMNDWFDPQPKNEPKRKVLRKKRNRF